MNARQKRIERHAARLLFDQVEKASGYHGRADVLARYTRSGYTPRRLDYLLALGESLSD